MKGRRHTLQKRETTEQREGSEDKPLRFSVRLGELPSAGKQAPSMAHGLVTQTSGTLWPGSHTHALPKRRLGVAVQNQCFSGLFPSLACPPAPNAISSLVGVFCPRRDPKQTPARQFSPRVVVVLPVPRSPGGWQRESWARADCHPTMGWQGGPGAAGKGSWEGWEPGALQVTHPRADNTRAGVGKSSTAHRGDPGFARDLPQAQSHASAARALPPIRQAAPAQEWLHPRGLVRQEGLGILFPALPTAGKSDLRGREERGGRGRDRGEEKNKGEKRAGVAQGWSPVRLRLAAQGSWAPWPLQARTRGLLVGGGGQHSRGAE